MSLHFDFRITNPFVKDTGSDCLFNKTWQVSKNKNFEIQIDGWSTSLLFEIGLRLRARNTDHSGVSFELGCPLFWLSFDFYDSRHAIETTEAEHAEFEKENAEYYAKHLERHNVKIAAQSEKAALLKIEKDKRDIVNRQKGLAKQAALKSK